MVKLLARIAINAIAIYVTARLMPGLEFTGTVWALLIVAVIFGLINAIIKPILKLLTLPITVMTLGLFALVINALMLIVTVWLSDSLSFAEGNGIFENLIVALIASIIISIISTILNKFVD